ncbi:MAG: ABA4-like family protein [Novosphingobium sp.]
MWSALFTFTNMLAIAGWLLLAAAPRKRAVRSLTMYLGVALLCLIYTVCFALFLSGAVDPVRVPGAGEPGFGSIAGVRALFASDGGVVIGWTHYLAFDLFTGMWIASDADNKGFGRVVQLPVLFATFMAGPVGLLAWLILRERRARAQKA